MKNVLTLCIILFSIDCIAQTYPLSDFSNYATPKAFSDSWLRLDTSKKPFSVSIVSGQLQISDAINSSFKELPTKNGKILTLDLGEWGGGLYYTSNDITKKKFFVNGKPVNVDDVLNGYKLFLSQDDPARKILPGMHLSIVGGNTSDIIPYREGWLFMQGDGNLKNSPGSISMLTMQKDSFTTTKLFDLKTSPTAIKIFKDKFFVTTLNGFYIIDGDKKELVLDDLFWIMLNPNSIAVLDDENIFIGLRGCYAKINAVTKNIKVYIYNK